MWSEDRNCKTPVEKAITWQESSEKLPPLLSPSISAQNPWNSSSSQTYLPSSNKQPLQSAYRADHSTETVLLRVVNDILSALDNDNLSVLLQLGLSAAFDTIDHQILLSRLYTLFDI